MKCYSKVNISNVIIARIMPKQKVRKAMSDILSKANIKKGVILSAIGSLNEVTFIDLKTGIELPFYPDDSKHIIKINKKGPFELLSMDGNIFPSDKGEILHLHVMLGTSDGSVIGGHLEDATVFTTIELLLAEINGSSISKGEDIVSGGIQIKFKK